jgi:hypothetical protein
MAQAAAGIKGAQVRNRLAEMQMGAAREKLGREEDLRGYLARAAGMEQPLEMMPQVAEAGGLEAMAGLQKIYAPTSPKLTKIREGAPGGMVRDVFVDPTTGMRGAEGEAYFPSAGLADIAPALSGEGPSISARQRQIEKMRTEGEKKAAKVRGQYEDAKKMSLDLDRFLALNETVQTGSLYGTNLAQTTAATMLPDVAEMKAIQDRLTPQMRQGMPGAASDRDVAMFRGATVGLGKPKEANANIVRAHAIQTQNLKDKADFIAWHQEKFGQAGASADRKWSKYLKENEIFDHKADRGAYKLNPSRIDWESWFIGGQREPESAICRRSRREGRTRIL